jgi:hypothetical protein
MTFETFDFWNWIWQAAQVVALVLLLRWAMPGLRVFR